jgi:hypothetical protein
MSGFEGDNQRAAARITLGENGRDGVVPASATPQIGFLAGVEVLVVTPCL